MPALLWSSFDELLFVLALTIDTFAISLVYGSQKIKIPLLSNLIINGTGTIVLMMSMITGVFCKQFIPEDFTRYLSFIIICIIGMMKCIEGIKKSTIENADENHDQIISPKEAIGIAISISMDGMSIGIGAALLNVSILIAGLLSFLIGVVTICIGGLVGRIVAKKTEMDYTLIGGILIILFALTKI
ncbi:MAG: manganese efflux pump [Eubacteriales bacterium]